jgi:hypothetical protein
LFRTKYNTFDENWWFHGCREQDREADASDEPSGALATDLQGPLLFSAVREAPTT